MFPEFWWTPLKFKDARSEKIQELSSKYGPELNCGCGQPGWHLEYDDFLTPLRKHKFKDGHSCRGCVIGSGVMEDNIHLLIQLAPPQMADSFLLRFYSTRKQFPKACRHGIFNLFKSETGLYKMGGMHVHPLWRVFCYWELGYGYVPYKDLDDMVPEVKKWLVDRLDLGGPLGREEYLDLLAAEAREFMHTEWKVPSEIPSIPEWLSTGKWMEGKSGTGQSVKITIDGRSARTTRAKPIDGVFFRDHEIAKELRTPVRERMLVMQKSEGGKIRAVVKTSNEINRKMNYLSSFLERGLYGSRLSTLFAGEKGNEDIDIDLINAARNPGIFKVPLDQSGFDQHQSRESILTILREVGLHMEKRLDFLDFSAVWAALWDSLAVHGASVEVGTSYRGEWGNGLPSGWRWTAVLDTLLNICSFRVIRKIAESRLGRPSWVGNFYAQGDDVIFSATDLEAVRLIIDTYGQVGYEVHPDKTYISTYRGEFLRRSYEPVGVTGYLARSLGNLRFRTPIQAAPLTPGERLYGALSQCHLMSLRIADSGACARFFLDQAEAQGLNRAQAAAYALTPNSQGGCGMDPTSAMGSVLATESDGNWYTMRVEKELRGVDIPLGAWEHRLGRIGWVPGARSRRKLIRTLAASWGVRESQTTGDAHSSFVEIEKKRPLPIPPGDMVPDVRGMWDIEYIPVQVRDLVQREAIEEGTEGKLLKREFWPMLEAYKKRMSRRVYTGYLLGEWTPPSPLVDQVGPRYGGLIKKTASAMIRRALMVRDIGLDRLSRYRLSVELWMRRELAVLGKWALLAQ